MRILVLVALMGLLQPAIICAAQQPTATASVSADILNHYLVYDDQPYETAGGVSLKLDVWQNQDSDRALPTVMYIHGGGWVFGDRMASVQMLFPYLQKHWNVVNVEYRLADQALAPAAVEDVRCALRWIYRNANKYKFDTARIIVTGHSAGGHLALMAGMVSADDGFDNDCPVDPYYADGPLRVAAVVNWFGITDVADLLSGPDTRPYAIEWVGGQLDRIAVAKRVSPLTYVRSGLPPIITIHGDSDPTVPYSHAVRLHEALDKAGDINQLVTIPGGKHGFRAFTDTQTQSAYDEVFIFLYGHIPGLK